MKLQHVQAALRLQTPHSFFELDREEFATASADAWPRVLAFIQLHQAAENATTA